ncbi:MAG: apolipoprotein N-acyltransferase [Beijerinckiaceae bacterium]|jgi:apolipoprotein N-acyltransferase
MLTLADRIILASGWTRRLIALVAGAAGALAMAPLNIGPALIIPMSVAVWLLDGSSEAQPVGGTAFFAWPGRGSLGLAFSAGWWLGFGYFLAGFWWLGSAFLMVPEFAWALPLGVVALPALLAFFPAFGFAVARLLWIPGAGRVFALALGLGLSEWLRGTILTGFPWNSLGMALGGTLVTAQIASLMGLHGLTLIAVAIFATPATLADVHRGGGLNWRPTLVAAGASALIVAFGAARLAQPPVRPVPNVIVRIMQPGIEPNDQFRPEHRDQILASYFALSRQDDPQKGVTLDDVTILVWPESPFPFILTRDPRAMADIGALLPPKAVLVTGAAREEDSPARGEDPAHTSYFNVIEVIASGGTLLDSYDKIHLVPFGEYLPFESFLRRLGLRNFVSIPGGFEPGSRRHNLSLPGLPGVSPLICYEAIFPGAVLSSSGPRPRLLLNVTDDGWFGDTFGPEQHFTQARLRSIEEGLPMIRAAATGISAFIDPYGRVLASLPLGKVGILDNFVPQPIAETLYAHYPYAIVLLISGIMILTLQVASAWNRKNKG